MMENSKNLDSEKENSFELPSLIRCASSNEVSGFDNAEENRFLNDRYQPSALQLTSPSAQGIETDALECALDESEPQIHQSVLSVSISMPTSAIELHLQDNKRMLFSGETSFNNGIPASSATLKSASSSTLPKGLKFHPQPMPKSSAFEEATKTGHFPDHSSIERLKDKRFDTFKTWSRKLDRQITLLGGKTPGETESENVIVQIEEVERLPADRYFDALEGPELDTLRASEEILLPADKQWPFLLRYPVSSFSICLGVSSQAILWKTLSTSASMKFLHLSLMTNLVLWCISVALIAIVAFIYLLKVSLYFEAVRREYYHPIRMNFFFAPWIVLLFLALGVPPSFANNLHPAIWYILMTPILGLELKIYGQWMSGGQRRLSMVANPFNHLAIVGNFVGALLGASMGLKEGPLFFFAVGLAHYIVLFVTLYQRLPTNETVIPKDLHPVFFLFVAAPSVASMAWAKIQGSFDYSSRIAYFIALFLYLSLVVRVNFFRGFKFSMAWWVYTFPMTGAASATIRYSNEVTNVVTQALAVTLSLIATITVIALLITTILHGLVLGNLFPNDIAIAISDRKPNPETQKKWFHLHGSSEAKDIENFLKSEETTSENKDLEAAKPSDFE
ncbi:hypothetical protein PRUPE_2G304300 [Prunus persica]|uniref:S-type anion channel SLAH2-like n=1 Tax=Prunus persica TaxID=3760 RepID=A0A251QPT2_PRUPE|nr:S-type anion channel SLAH2 isoform X1 [Prunus persica]ONI25450.1 hypothetical protein PRUPE_2G304300 [Prunus persica]